LSLSSLGSKQLFIIFPLEKTGSELQEKNSPIKFAYITLDR